MLVAKVLSPKGLWESPEKTIRNTKSRVTWLEHRASVPHALCGSCPMVIIKDGHVNISAPLLSHPQPGIIMASDKGVQGRRRLTVSKSALKATSRAKSYFLSCNWSLEPVTGRWSHPNGDGQLFLGWGTETTASQDAVYRAPIDDSIPVFAGHFGAMTVSLLAKPCGKLTHPVPSEGRKTNTGLCCGQKL